MSASRSLLVMLAMAYLWHRLDIDGALRATIENEMRAARARVVDLESELAP